MEQGNQGIDQGNNFVPYFLPIGFGQYFWPNTDIVPRFAVNFEDDPADQNWATEIMKPQKSPLVPENFPYEEQISADQYQPQISADQYQPQISADQYQPQISADQYQPQISAGQNQLQPVPKKKAGFSDVLMGLLNRLVEGHIQLSFSPAT